MYGGIYVIVYSVEGLYGIWLNIGNYKYQKILVIGQWLEDKCSSGISWYMWNKLKFVWYDFNG